MKNNITELVFVFDKSGSMVCLESNIIGGAIRHIGRVYKFACHEDVSEQTVFVITADGIENASRRYTSDKVKAIIERQKEKYGQEIFLIGANIDAVEAAAKYSIGANRALIYNADKEGKSVVYKTVANSVCNVRASTPLAANWSDDINEDYVRRGKSRK